MMTWRVALVRGLLLETLIVGVLALYAFGVIPLSVFGGVHISRVAFVLHVPGSILSLPLFWVATNIGGLGVLQGALVAAIIGGALQVAFLAALVLAVVRHPRISAAASLVLPVVLVVAVFIVKVGTPPPYPAGMDANRDRLVSIEEWTSFNAGHPTRYGARGTADFYKREFNRVDCDHDSAMDAYEYGELHWNLRTCTSPNRPMRPWWR